MSQDSKLKIIKKIKESAFFYNVFDNTPFPTDKKITVFLNNIPVGEMDVKCISLIDQQLNVQYFVQNVGRINLMYRSDKKVDHITLDTSHKNEKANVLINRTHMTFRYSNESFITLDHTSGYKITDCSCPTAIDADLFRNPYKTFNQETLLALRLSEF